MTARMYKEFDSPPRRMRTEVGIPMFVGTLIMVVTNEEVESSIPERYAQSVKSRGVTPRLPIGPRRKRINPNAVPRSVRPSALTKKFPTRYVVHRLNIIIINDVVEIGVRFVKIYIFLDLLVA